MKLKGLNKSVHVKIQYQEPEKKRETRERERDHTFPSDSNDFAILIPSYP